MLQFAEYGADVPCVGVWHDAQSVLVGWVIGSQATPACGWQSTHVVAA